MNKAIYRKACKKIDAMLDSTDSGWISEIIPVNGVVNLLVEVTRITEEDMDVYYGEPGTAVGLELYITDKSGREMDGITVGSPLEEKYKADLYYLLGMY
jgi:hypothetical protein